MANVSNREESITRTQDTSTYRLTSDQVRQQFEQLNPGPINVACSDWARAADRLGTIANRLLSEAGQALHRAWESDSSPDAQQHLQVAQATAHALADQCMQMARATDYAYRYADWYKAHVPGDGHFSTQADADRAGSHLTDMLSRYNEVIVTVIPAAVRAQYVESQPDRQPPGGHDTFTPDRPTGGQPPVTHPPGIVPPHPQTGQQPGGTSGGSSPGSGLAGFPPGSGQPGLGSPTGPGGAGSVPAGFGGSPYDAGSALAGSGLDGGLGAGSGLGSGGPAAGGVGSGAPAAGGLGAGTGSGGVGGGLPGGIPAGGRGGTGSAGGRPGAGAGAGGAGAGAGAAGRGGAPMHGGGDGDEQERERSTWLTEDDDVWGGDPDAPPPVIRS